MGRFIDLTGSKFNKLTVIKKDNNKSKLYNRVHWICECECGNIISVASNNLTSGHTQSCGCLKNNKIIDLTNCTFGRLTVVKLDENRTEYGKIYWICKCECGKILSVFVGNLTSGHTQSCGCLRDERISESNSKSNRIEFDSSYGCLKVYFNNCDEYFLCDIEDRDIAEKHCWCKNNNGYVIGGNIKSLFHREVMSKYYNIDVFVIDHINHNKLDNRKCNLRVCTFGENLRNSRPSSNTREKFISFNKNKNRYDFTFNNKFIKSFNNINDAIIYRDNYLKEYPDEFRYNPNEDYINQLY